MQNAYKHQLNTPKTWMQHDNMKLHAKLSKFHIEHTQNGATVQHTHYTSHSNNLSITATGILQASKQQATASQRNNKRHGHKVQVKHNKT